MRTINGRWGRFGLAIVMVAALVVACGGDNAPTIAQARIGAPTGPNAAMYFIARGYAEDDVLIGASTDVAANVEMHRTISNDDGTMTMEALDSIELPAEGRLILKPGGNHLMLIGVDDLAVGDTVEVTLTWEKAGDITVEAEVVDPADTASDG